MHIWNNIKDFLYDNNDFFAYYNNYIYLYNFKNIIDISDSVVSLMFSDKKIVIKGNGLCCVKCLDNELVLKGFMESVNIYEI